MKLKCNSFEWRIWLNRILRVNNNKFVCCGDHNLALSALWQAARDPPTLGGIAGIYMPIDKFSP